MNDQEKLNQPRAMEGLWHDTVASGFSMASDPLTCSLLRTLAASKPSGRFLELGSGTGLSTAWILDGMDQTSSLTTVDNDASFLGILDKHLGSDPRLEIVCADGDAFLQSQGVPSTTSSLRTHGLASIGCLIKPYSCSARVASTSLTICFRRPTGLMAMPPTSTT